MSSLSFKVVLLYFRARKYVSKEFLPHTSAVIFSWRMSEEAPVRRCSAVCRHLLYHYVHQYTEKQQLSCVLLCRVTDLWSQRKPQQIRVDDSLIWMMNLLLPQIMTQLNHLYKHDIVQRCPPDAYITPQPYDYRPSSITNTQPSCFVVSSGP